MNWSNQILENKHTNQKVSLDAKGEMRWSLKQFSTTTPYNNGTNVIVIVTVLANVNNVNDNNSIALSFIECLYLCILLLNLHNGTESHY